MFRAGDTKKRAFTKDHIQSIMVFAFEETPKAGMKKHDWLDHL